MAQEKKWSEEVFVFRGIRRESEPSKLILELEDGTERVFKYANWTDASVRNVELHVLELKPGANIRIATWREQTWSANEWFCDVEEVK